MLNKQLDEFSENLKTRFNQLFQNQLSKEIDDYFQNKIVLEISKE
jgi:hypothetical protein